jgi:hypothetical protein
MGKSVMGDDEKIEKKYQGNTRHDKRCYEGSYETLLRSILQARPAEYVEVTGPIHMLWIDYTSIGVYKIIVNEHLIPRRDKIDVDIESDLQISIHAKETGQGTISGIMKGHAI